MNNKKIKLVMVGVIILLGALVNVNQVSAQTIITTNCTSATISGHLDLNGNSSASVWFEWGPTASLGNSTQRQTFTSDSDFSQTIFNLTNNKTYYYRAMGSNDAGTETGDIKSFKVTCSGDSGNDPTVNLRADDTMIDSGDSTTLRWDSDNADSCRASGGTNGWSGSISTSGSFDTGDLDDDETYRIACINEFGSADDSVTVRVDDNNNNDNVTVDISASPSSVNYNGSSIITWDSDNADSCRASGGTNGWSGSRSRSGSFRTGSLTNTTTFSINCRNDNDSDNASTTVSVNSQPQPINNQPTVVIFADSTNLAFNGATTVRWNTTNATSCFASGGSVGWAGTKSIGPGSFFTGSLTGTRTFAISCSNDSGSSVDSVTINVRGQVLGTTTVRPAPTSLVLVTSSVDRNRPIVPTLDNTNPCPGDEVTYTITYQNVGTGSIRNLALRVDLPLEVDYMFSNPNNPIRSGNTLIFNLGTLRANGQGTVTVRVRVRDNAPAGASLNFPAILSYIDPSGFPQQVAANVSANVCGAVVVANSNVSSLGAGVFGAGFLPASIFGWLLLLILILVLVLLAKHLFDQSFQRKTITTTE